MPEPGTPALVGELFAQLQRRRFPIGPPDLAALRTALAAGFGWSSQDALRELIVALWAKSTREAEVMRTLFARLAWPAEWTPEKPHGPHPPVDPGEPGAVAPMPLIDITAATHSASAPTAAQPVVRAVGSLPMLSLAGIQVSDARTAMIEQYPLTHREIAQAFRRLRRPMRFGPATELDLDATIHDRLRTGIAMPPALRPRRRNSSRLALFVDVDGSMAPFAPFVDAFCQAIREAGLLQQTSLHYFHDVPTEGADRALLGELDPRSFFPVFDPVLGRIEALDTGEVFVDRHCEQGVTLRTMLASMAPGTAALVVSDAGAAVGRADLGRVLDTLGFAKALRARASAVVWLNPVPRPLWANTVAAQLARHLPMYAMDRAGIQFAVNALRGHPVNLERPL